MNIDKNRKIRDAHRTFVYKTLGNVEKILTEHVGDLTSFTEKLTALKALLTEKLERTKKLDEAILELTKPKELEKEIEDSDRRREAGTSAMTVSNNANSVLLQVAQAFVCRPDNQQLGLNAHVIFDSCSQRSYITSKACEQLNLPTIGKETLLIKTFGDNLTSVKECDVVQLCVRTLDEMNVYITSYVVPVICSPVSNQRSRTTLECYPYLQGLQLACDSDSVDVLIGADYYWLFFTGNIIKGDPHGPVALETKLGWVLS
ncbi:uncharacterized protein [Montipora capricornis]|uniref:uncharacterized protein n=1 Tax=Montipora capricornis TaxID=246305 RepID=UPI0035F120B7